VFNKPSEKDCDDRIHIGISGNFRGGHVPQQPDVGG
jgi:hypothetical protein